MASSGLTSKNWLSDPAAHENLLNVRLERWQLLDDALHLGFCAIVTWSRGDGGTAARGMQGQHEERKG